MQISTYSDDALGVHDAVALREALTNGDVSPSEVREAAVNRARAAEPLNAVVTWLDQDEPHDGRFAGVPTFVKDNEDLEGYPTTFGSRATTRRPAQSSSRFVRHWEQLGFATLGKSALPEFGLTATTEPLEHGPTRNPWNLEYSCGGSSGGSAALVAAGVVPITHANDGGGSIRIPASCCGLVGLKPSRGRLVDVEAMDQLPVKIVTQGVLTRTVRDTVEFYRAMSQIHPVDHLPPIDATGRPGTLRVGVFTEGIGGLPVDPQVRVAVEDAAKLCESLGHRVDYVGNPFDDQIAQDFLRYWGMLAFTLQRLGSTMFGKDYEPKELEPFSIFLSKYFSSIAVGLPGSLRRLRRFGAAYESVFEGFDVLLSPVLGSPPAPIGYLGPDVEPREHLVRLLRYASFTALQNIAGAPAITLPTATSAEGLPIGVQFAGAVGQEQVLLDLAASIEEAQPWLRLDHSVTGA
ncbi:MAG: amidase [Candidatus Nanopelagicales bacterium]